MSDIALEFDIHIQRALRWSACVLAAVFVLLLGGVRHPVFLGFTVGVAVSVVNGYLLALRVKGLTDFALLTRGRAEGVDKVRTVFRAGLVVVRWVILFAVLFLGLKTGWFDLLGLLAGLFVLPAFSLGSAFRLAKERR
ncbi:MAG: ATP synthase subunit I [Bacillota bacterium]|nr:ATP synthase subunit I [Bacillota bacterium]